MTTVATKNPFRFGNPVAGDYYLPRADLARTVQQFLQNRIHLVLIGPRRFGKTSFVTNLLGDFDREGYTTFFVDIFNITSHKDFLNQLLRALNPKKSWSQKFIEKIPSLKPKISLDIDQQTGEQSFGLSLENTSEKDVKNIIQDVLGDLEKLGENVLVVIDEFQKVTEIEDEGWLEATLRTFMQQLKNTSFLFTGSRKSIIYDMLNNHTRPFYRSCQSIEFPSFGNEFTDWILQRFNSIGISGDADTIKHLRNLVQDTPNYVQMVCFHLVARGVTHIDIPIVERTLALVVKQNSYAYQTLLSSLTSTQQRALRLAANEPKHIFAKDNLKKYEISSPPALSSAIKSLKDKNILEASSRGQIIFDDPLLAIWLRVAFS